MNEDARLLEQIRDGDADDFAIIVQRHQARVFAILSRYERDAHRVEDLAQETFLKAWRALAQFDGRAPFEHWISKIATHIALDHLRRQKQRQQDISLSELGADALDWLRDHGAQNELDAREAAEILELAMRELPPVDRVIITMQEIEGCRHKEIAGTIGCSSISVRVRAMRARARLKRALEKLSRL